MKKLLVLAASILMWSQANMASPNIMLNKKGGVHPGNPGNPVNPYKPGKRDPVGNHTVLLGDTQLSVKNDHDRVDTRSCAKGFRITHISLQVINQDADIDRVVAHFGDGSAQILDVRERFAQGSSSRWVDLRGNGARCVTDVDVYGSSNTLFGRHATVRVWGLAIRN